MSGKDEMMVVKLTLRKHVAERLRKMCHAKNLTASHLVDRWVFEHDDNGDAKAQVQPKQDPMSALFGDMFGGGPFGGRKP